MKGETVMTHRSDDPDSCRMIPVYIRADPLSENHITH